MSGPPIDIVRTARRCAHRAASRWSAGHILGDLEQEAALAISTAMETHDPERGDARRYAERCAARHLRRYICSMRETADLALAEDTLPAQDPGAAERRAHARIELAEMLRMLDRLPSAELDHILDIRPMRRSARELERESRACSVQMRLRRLLMILAYADRDLPPRALSNGHYLRGATCGTLAHATY